MNIISWNVNGLRAVWKRGLLEFMASEARDLFCVQETKIQHEDLSDDMRRPHGYRYSGVVTYARSDDELRGREKAAGIMRHVKGSDHCPIITDPGRSRRRVVVSC